MDSRLKEILLKFAQNKMAVEEITDDTRLVEDLGYDSIQMIEFILEVESAFDMCFDDDDFDLEMISTYAKLREFILGKEC